MKQHSARGFTGRHMALVLTAFFAVVIAVNLVMARFAIGTFGGTVVANSYVASQHYNDWLAEGRRQAALGWQVRLTRDANGHLLLDARDREGQTIAGLNASAVAEHPLGRQSPLPLRFASDAAGFVSTAALPAGRWRVRVQLNRAGDRFQQTVDVQ